MIPNIKLNKIYIYSDILGNRKDVFFWNFKKINFLLGKNDCGKTTLFHILKDILGNPNVAGNNNSGSNIFTNDIITKGLEVELYFSIGKKDFYTIKKYSGSFESIKKSKKTTQFFYEIGKDIAYSKLSFFEYLNNSEILDFPKVIFNDKSKITFNSLMRFSFIEQSHFGKEFKIENKSSSNIIIKHYNDGRTKVLLYLYLLGILEDEEKLTDYYNILSDYSHKEGELKKIKTQIRSLSGNDFNPSIGLFSDTFLLSEINNKNKLKRNLTIDNLNYKDLYDKYSEIYSFNERMDKESNIEYKKLLSEDIQIIKNKIILNSKKISDLERNIFSLKGKIKQIDDIMINHFIDELEKVDSNEKDLYKSLIKKSEKLQIDIEILKDKYDDLVYLLNSSKEFKTFEGLLNEFVEFLGEKELKLLLEKGRYHISTTSDSINRIVLVNILSALVFLKNKLNLNHTGFIVFDSPLVGVEKEKEEMTLKSLKEKEEIYGLDGQFFMFLNPEEVDVEKIYKEDDLVSIKKVDGKLLKF